MSVGRFVGRVLAVCQPSVGRFPDSSLLVPSQLSVGQLLTVCRTSNSGMSADCWLTVGRLLAVFQPSVGLPLAFCWPSVGLLLAFYWPSIGLLLAFYWPSIGLLLAFYWPSVGLLLLSAVSMDHLPDPMARLGSLNRYRYGSS